MSARKVTVTLTVPQAEALLSAIAQVTAGPEDTWTARELGALDRAGDQIASAVAAVKGA